MSINLFIDTGSKSEIIEVLNGSDKKIDGITTNNSLLAAAGNTNVIMFARHILNVHSPLELSVPISGSTSHRFEYQLHQVHSLGHTIRLKLLIGEITTQHLDLVEKLYGETVKLNLTGYLGSYQDNCVDEVLARFPNTIISVFCGRISDMCGDPTKTIAGLRRRFRTQGPQILWAGARQVADYLKANSSGCDIITMPGKLILALDRMNMNKQEMQSNIISKFNSDGELLCYD